MIPRTAVRRVRHAAMVLVVAGLLPLAATPVAAAGVTGIDLALPVGTTMTGHVFDAHGDPAAGVDVGVCPDAFDCFAASSPSGADGSFTVQGITPGTYIAMAQGDHPNTLATYYGGPGSSVTDGSLAVPLDLTVDVNGIDITLDPGFTMSGTLVDGLGEGVPDVFVSVSGPTGGGATTDSNGDYAVGGLSAGSYAVFVQPPEDSPFTQGAMSGGTIVPEEANPIDVSADLAGVDATLVPGASITGTISGLTRPADISGNGLTSRFVPVAPDGSFAIRGMWSEQPVQLIVQEHSDDPNDNQFPVGVYDGSPNLTIDQNAATGIDLSGGDVTGLALAAPTAPKLTGTVSDGHGGTITGWVVVCSDALGCANPVFGAGGTYAAYNLPNSTYTVFVVAAGHPNGYATPSGGITDDVTQAAHITINGADATRNVTLPVGQTISGRITGPLGEPVPGASVSATSGTPAGFAFTDADGQYTIPGLLGGDYNIRVNGPEGGPYLAGYWSPTGYTTDFDAAGLVHVANDQTIVTTTTPIAGATNVVRTVQPSAVFSGGVANVSSSTIWLHQAGSTTKLKGTLSYNPTTFTATFKPKVKLHARATYVLEINGVTAIDGSAVPPVSVTFTTRR